MFEGPINSIRARLTFLFGHWCIRAMNPRHISKLLYKKRYYFGHWYCAHKEIWHFLFGETMLLMPYYTSVKSKIENNGYFNTNDGHKSVYNQMFAFIFSGAKLLIKQLSKHEFLQFMAQVYDRDQSDFMSSLVFNHFVRTSSIVNPNADDLNSIYQFHIINNYSITKTKTKRSSNERCQIKHTPHSSHWPVCFVSAPKLIIQTIEKWLLLLEMWIN